MSGLCARAATLSSQSSAGIQSEYASNPLLVPSGVQSAQSLALVATVPLTYNSDSITIDLTPQLRYGATHGPVALLSNYEYLDGDWRWGSERNTFAATGSVHHDSTLYNYFEDAALGGRSLGRLEQQASLSWQRALTELSDVQLSASWDQLNYSRNFGSILTDYSYGQVSGQYDQKLSALWQWTSTAGYGRYELPGGVYTSYQRFAQTALSRTLSERWSASIQVGYAYLTAFESGYECAQLVIEPDGSLACLVLPVTASASKGSPDFLVSMEHRDERLVVDLTASRAVQPSGLGALLTQDTVGLAVNFPWTERLTVNTGVQWQRLEDSLTRDSLDNRQYYQLTSTASWQWTQRWAVQLQGTYVLQELGPNLSQDHGTTLYLTLSRQFGRLRL
jgi:hypothetical protein